MRPRGAGIIVVSTPERGKPGAAEATEFVRAWLDTNAGGVTAHTRKADSFGRWLADLHNEAGESLSTALLEAGHAVPYAR